MEGPRSPDNNSAGIEKLRRDKRRLEKLLLSLGYKYPPHESKNSNESFRFLIDSDGGTGERGGARVSIKPGTIFIQLMLIGNPEKNSRIIDAINRSGLFSAVRDSQEKSGMFEYFDVLAEREPKGLLEGIRNASVFSHNRVLALLRKIFTG